MLGCDKTGGYSYYYEQKPGSREPGFGAWDTEVGYGKINAFKTLQYVLGTERHLYNLTGTKTGSKDISKLRYSSLFSGYVNVGFRYRFS